MKASMKKNIAAISIALCFQQSSEAGVGSILDSIVGKKATLHVELFDKTASINQKNVDSGLYLAASKRDINTLKLGDRVIIGRIGSDGLKNFKIDTDLQVVRTGRHFEDIDRINKLKNLATESVESIVKEKNISQKTLILDTLSALEPLLSEARQKEMLIKIYVLTDAIEQSRSIDFEKQEITDSFIEHVISQRKKDQLLPNLERSEVYFVGASGRDSQTVKRIEKFWRAYISACGGKVSFYGRTIPSL